MKNKRAFTLIELLVVGLIIGILAAVALPQFQKAVEKARLTEVLGVISSLEKSMDLYVLENGYPSAEETVNFLGTARYAIENVSLDVSYPLDCSPFPGTGFCFSQYYSFSAGCHEDLCSISAKKGTIDEYEEDNAEDAEINLGDNYHYQLGSSRTSSSNTWTHSCRSADDMGAKMCAALQDQGWTN